MLRNFQHLVGFLTAFYRVSANVSLLQTRVNHLTIFIQSFSSGFLNSGLTFSPVLLSVRKYVQRSGAFSRNKKKIITFLFQFKLIKFSLIFLLLPLRWVSKAQKMHISSNCIILNEIFFLKIQLFQLIKYTYLTSRYSMKFLFHNFKNSVIQTPLAVTSHKPILSALCLMTSEI